MSRNFIFEMRPRSPILINPRHWRRARNFLMGIFLFFALLFIFTSSWTIMSIEGNFPKKTCNSDGILPFSFEQARFDTMRIIRIYEWIWVGSRWKELTKRYDVCLSTQSSLDRLYWVPDVLEKWQGPISLAVFIASPQEWIGLNFIVKHLQKCFPPFEQFVSIHIALPAELKFHPETIYYDPLSVEEFPCKQTREFVKYILDKFPRGKDGDEYIAVYPQNHMRNIARKTCPTKWTFATDIDIIPRQGSAPMLQEFYESADAQNCNKCAFVIPTYELVEQASFPATKEELIEYQRNNMSQPFHVKVFLAGHNATNYRQWSNSTEDESSVVISYDADPTIMKFYEPFYISSDTIPAFEERFIGYGFTRSSQVQEALSNGWVFKVLSPIFSIHWGFQNRRSLLAPKNEITIRRQQTKNNSLIFKKFIKELNYKKYLKHSSQETKRLRKTDYRRFTRLM